MIYVHQLATYYRRLVDDSDQTFFSQDELAQALSIGYQQFRNLVYSHQPDVLQQVYSVTVPNAFVLNLDNVLFGTTPSQTRCMRILRIQSLNQDGSVRRLYRPVGSVEQLQTLSYAATPAWTLQRRELRFNFQCNDTIQIVYLPQDTINWTAGVVPASNVYIDDLVEWHDLIALFAVQQYAIKDFQMNPAVSVQLATRKADFLSYLTSTRDGDASRIVQWEHSGLSDY